MRRFFSGDRIAGISCQEISAIRQLSEIPAIRHVRDSCNTTIIVVVLQESLGKIFLQYDHHSTLESWIDRRIVSMIASFKDPPTIGLCNQSRWSDWTDNLSVDG